MTKAGRSDAKLFRTSFDIVVMFTVCFGLILVVV